MYENVRLIRMVVTMAFSFVIGYVAALWVTYLDPDGTGGGILAAPAIISVMIFSGLTLIVGVAALRTKYGGYFILSAFLVPILFFVSTILVR